MPRVQIHAALTADGRVAELPLLPKLKKESAYLLSAEDKVVPPDGTVVLVDEKGKLKAGHPAFRLGRSVIVFSTARLDTLAKKADVWTFEESRIVWPSLLGILGEDYHLRSLIALSPSLTTDLLDAGALNEIHLNWLSRLSVKSEQSTLTGNADSFLPHLVKCRLKRKQVDSDHCRLVYEVKA